MSKFESRYHKLTVVWLWVPTTVTATANAYKKNVTNLDSILNRLTNFPLEAQLQLILSQASAQYFKMSHYNHLYYVMH